MFLFILLYHLFIIVKGNGCGCSVPCCNYAVSLPVYQMQPMANQMSPPKNKKLDKNTMEIELKKAYDQAHNEETIYVIPTLNKKSDQLPSFPLFGIKLPEYINLPGPDNSIHRPSVPSVAPGVSMRSFPTIPPPTSTTPSSRYDPLDVLVGLHNNTQTLKEAQDLLHQILDILSQKVISEPFKAFDEQPKNLTEFNSNETMAMLESVDVNEKNETAMKNEGSKTVTLHSHSITNTKSESAPMEEPESEENNSDETRTANQVQHTSKYASCPGIYLSLYLLLIIVL